MKRIEKRRTETFIRQLMQHSKELKRLKPREVRVFNIIANYGSYQVIVGPEYSSEECRKLQLKPHSRRLEINGSMHHLFVNRKKISALPGEDEISSNLKGSVIMKDIIIHIVDKDGEGKGVKIERLDQDGIQAERRINLAGDDGDSMIDKYKSSGRLDIEAYKIIQEDILKALKGS